MPESPLILVAEDDYFVLADIEEALTDAGFGVEGAASGEEALRLFRGGKAYKAVVTDVNLAGQLCGWDLARRIRETEPAFPLVYLTGAAAEQWTAQGVPGSVLIAKPFAPAQLVTAISNLLNIGTVPNAGTRSVS